MYFRIVVKLADFQDNTSWEWGCDKLDYAAQNYRINSIL